MVRVHPLDHAAWSALTGRQSHLAIVRDGARRYAPGYGVFAAVQDRSPRNLAGLGALVAAHGDVALLEADPPAEAPGLSVVSQDLGVQMVAERVTARPAADFEMVALTDADGPQMLALATLTQPGPFFERTQ